MPVAQTAHSNTLFHQKTLNQALRGFSFPADLATRHQIVSQWITSLNTGTLIKKAVAQGYSFTEIAKIFNERRVKISAQQIKEHYEALEASQHSEKALEAAPNHAPTAVAAAETASPKTVAQPVKRTANEEEAQTALAES